MKRNKRKNPYRKEIKEKTKDYFIYDKYYLFVDEEEWDLYVIAKFEYYNESNEPMFNMRDNSGIDIKYFHNFRPLSKFNYYKYIYGPFDSYENAYKYLDKLDKL